MFACSAPKELNAFPLLSLWVFLLNQSFMQPSARPLPCSFTLSWKTVCKLNHLVACPDVFLWHLSEFGHRFCEKAICCEKLLFSFLHEIELLVKPMTSKTLAVKATTWFILGLCTRGRQRCECTWALFNFHGWLTLGSRKIRVSF